MIGASDLYTIGTSGVRAQRELLETTSNNIANVNTEGYVRERTSHVSQVTGGVGRASSERLLNTFAQNQLRRDTSQVGQYEMLYEKATQLDQLLGSSANSLATGLSSFFAALQTSTSQPTNLSARQLVISEANALNNKMKSMGEYLETKEKEVNLELEGMSEEANSLIKTISELNKEIQAAEATNQYAEPGALKNARDQAILELSELIPLSTIEREDGTTLVNLKTGQALVMQDGTFNVFSVSGDPDPRHKKLQLSQPGNNLTFDLAEKDLGGKMGGLLEFRDDVLAKSQRDLGQMALVFADSMNEQNNLGMDYDGELGSDIFTLPTFTSLGYNNNANASHTVNARVEAGRGSELTDVDYQITITGVTAGAPNQVDFTVALLNPDGSAVVDSAGNPITQAYTNQTAAPGTFVSIRDGLEIEFPNGAAYTANNDQFLIQPSKAGLTNLEVNITRGEDLALASPIRVESQSANLGNAGVTSTSVTNTTVSNNADGSAFTAAGGIHAPGGSPAAGLGAPAAIEFTSANNYRVLDSAGNTISTVTGATDLNNLIEKARAGAGWPATFNPPTRDNYPGYDVSLQGVPQAGDRFDISFNTDGVNDNTNGLELGALQDKDTVRRDPTQAFSSTNSGSYHESYSTTVSDVGQKTSAAETSLKAAEALKAQSKSAFDSTSGVNLDEEAANLIRFQQAYTASARILSTAQTIFDTILGAVR